MAAMPRLWNFRLGTGCEIARKGAEAQREKHWKIENDVGRNDLGRRTKKSARNCTHLLLGKWKKETEQLECSEIFAICSIIS